VLSLMVLCQLLIDGGALSAADGGALSTDGGGGGGGGGRKRMVATALGKRETQVKRREDYQYEEAATSR